MNFAANKTMMYVIGGLVLAFLLWLYFRGVKGVVADTAKATVDAATGAATGIIVGLGDAVGIPETDTRLCEQACAAGQSWAASKYCTATRFASYLWNGK